ncbi:HAD family hydrolase [Paenibacillus sp. GCM10012303]|uniref:HAD family hydrolase n=1 Tax=Paenibacillus sp. GCM10012303 TaxID=3317340 RepID=UPI0036D3684E
MIKGIIFDFDGVILDTETIEFRVFEDIFEEYGVKLPLEMWERRIGGNKNNFDPYDYLIEYTQCKIDKIELKKHKKIRYEKKIGNENLLPGVYSYLESAKKMNIQIGLASSSPRKRIVDLLKRFEIIHYFTHLATAEDVDHVKPNPDLYLHVLEKMKLEPSHVIAIEDSPTGLIAAKRAGIYCVIVPNEVTKRLTFQQYDLRVNSLDEIELSDLIKIPK